LMAMQCQHCVTQASRYSENGERVALRPVQKCCAMQQRARAQLVRGGQARCKSQCESHGTNNCNYTQVHFARTHLNASRSHAFNLLTLHNAHPASQQERLQTHAGRRLQPHRSCLNTKQQSPPNNASTVHAAPQYIPTPTSNALANTHVLLYSRLAAHIDR